MSDTNSAEKTPGKSGSKAPLLLGMVLALAGAGGGFYAVQSGMLLKLGTTEEVPAKPVEAARIGAMPDVAFVPVEPLIVSLTGKDANRVLRFRAQLEVASAHKSEVEILMPRVVDVLNTYLRALRLEDLTETVSMVRLRAQMLRRVQIVTGGDRVSDLLIMEFVLN